ncbi:hypothetical protein Tco_1186603, partial [Tanacetum coccineum]
METIPGKDYILLPLWTADPPFSQSSKSSPDAGFKPSGNDEKKDANVNSTNNVNAASTNEVTAIGRKISIELLDEPNMPALEDIIYSDDDEDVVAEADINNLDAFMLVSPIPTTRVHKDHLVNSLGTSSGGGPRRQETIGDTISQTRSENVSKFSNDPLLARVIDLVNIKTAQAQEITSLKLRVKKLEKKGGSRT